MDVITYRYPDLTDGYFIVLYIYGFIYPYSLGWFKGNNNHVIVLATVM